MIFGSNTTKNEFVLGDGTIVHSAKEHLVLGIITDSSLTFNSDLKQLRKKIANKRNGFTKTEPCLSGNQRQLIYSFFFYWTIKLLPINMDLLLQTTKSSYKQTPKKALGIVYNDYDSSFSELLEMSNESASHIKSIKVFMTEVYKFLNDLSPSIINDIFQKTRKLLLYKKPNVPSSK